ncbi:MAG: TraR/DksA C4-type zinc finger protein [Candidatus Shapirobacteria bacterium]|jgi:DnaK suppressor protein
MNNLKFPNSLLVPIKKFLEGEVVRLKRREKNLGNADPFNNEERLVENSSDEDVNEQLGHFESTIKVNFVKKQVVQFRRALTRLRIGKYGTCEKCGKMIDTDRLAARPESTICIICEREIES